MLLEELHTDFKTKGDALSSSEKKKSMKWIITKYESNRDSQKTNLNHNAVSCDRENGPCTTILRQICGALIVVTRRINRRTELLRNTKLMQL